MRRVRAFAALAAIGALLLPCAVASAQGGFQQSTGVTWDTAGPDAPVPGSTFTVYTGISTNQGTLTLLDASPPVRDDVVAFDLLPEQINNYLPIAGGVQRSVTESVTVNPDLTQTMTIRVNGTNAAGAPADLWPSGLAAGTLNFQAGALGLGLNLGAGLGNDPFNFVGSTITAANVVVTRSGVDQAPVTIPLNFFGPSPSNWDGIIGLFLENAATGATVENALTFNITYTPIPEPATLGVAALLVPNLLLRRRNRHAAR
jgi:hypothetical protein